MKNINIYKYADPEKVCEKEFNFVGHKKQAQINEEFKEIPNNRESLSERSIRAKRISQISKAREKAKADELEKANEEFNLAQMEMAKEFSL